MPYSKAGCKAGHRTGKRRKKKKKKKKKTKLFGTLAESFNSSV